MLPRKPVFADKKVDTYFKKSCTFVRNKFGGFDMMTKEQHIKVKEVRTCLLKML